MIMCKFESDIVVLGDMYQAAMYHRPACIDSSLKPGITTLWSYYIIALKS